MGCPVVVVLHGGSRPELRKKAVPVRREGRHGCLKVTAVVRTLFNIVLLPAVGCFRFPRGNGWGCGLNKVVHYRMVQEVKSLST